MPKTVSCLVKSLTFRLVVFFNILIILFVWLERFTKSAIIIDERLIQFSAIESSEQNRVSGHLVSWATRRAFYLSCFFNDVFDAIADYDFEGFNLVSFSLIFHFIPQQVSCYYVLQ